MKSVLGTAIASALCVLPSAAAGVAMKGQSATLPSPQVVFRGTDTYEANGFDFVRFQYEVTNKARFAKNLFATAPDLPACGKETPTRISAAIFDSDGKRITEFCALPDQEGLGRLWFAIAKGSPQPKSIYIEITDRATGVTTRSKTLLTSRP